MGDVRLDVCLHATLEVLRPDEVCECAGDQCAPALSGPDAEPLD